MAKVMPTSLETDDVIRTQPQSSSHPPTAPLAPPVAQGECNKWFFIHVT